jgi:hypothetical protein
VETVSAHPRPSEATYTPLTPVLSERYALSAGQFGIVAVLTAWCWYLSYIPLFHAVTWRHAMVGRWIAEHNALPTVDPTLPLADGMQWTTTSWLSDLLLHLLERTGGPLALQATLVVLVGGASIGLARLLYVETSSKRWMLAGLALVLPFVWTRVGVLRPELAGAACFVALLLMLRRLRAESTPNSMAGWASGAWMPLLMAAWANLDGSVLLGVVASLCFAVGEFLDGWLERRDPRLVARDDGRRWRIWIAQASIAATLCTPLGWELWRQAVSLSTSSLGSALGGFRPIVVASWQGLGLLTLWVLFGALLRHSRVPFRAGDVLAFIAFTLIAGCQQSLASWFAVVATVTLLPHAARLAQGCGWGAPRSATAGHPCPPPEETANPDEGSNAAFQFAYSLAAVLVIWVAFALSPLATPMLGGKPRPLNRVYSPDTPHAVADFLRGNAPKGLVWCPEEWGDWLGWSGPAGMKVSANSNASILPRIARTDYAQVAKAEGTWTRTLDRYGVEYLTIEKQSQQRLADAVQSTLESWTVVYEDDAALIARRKEAGE